MTLLSLSSFNFFYFCKHALGKCAVAVFFMVSGFLIPSTLEYSKSLRTYAIHRTLRLYPAYFSSILIILLLNAFTQNGTSYTWTQILANLTMCYNLFRQTSLDPTYWTLEIEIFFYAICAVLFIGKILHCRGWLVIVFVALALTAALIRWKTDKQMPVVLFVALSLMFAADGIRHGDRLAWHYLLTQPSHRMK